MQICLPTALDPVVKVLARHGTPRIVGGFVRDALLEIPSEDVDIEVGGLDFAQLESLLKPFGATDVVGRSFGTIKLSRAGRHYDFSLPRRESKTGSGHRGFKVDPDPSLTLAEASARRDFTINAIAWDPVEQRIMDPLDGRRDLESRILRHCSPAFAEDPLRVLRAMQLAARFDFELHADTAQLCRSISSEFASLPAERVWGEWEKWATQSARPSQGLRALQQSGWIRHFPEIDALQGVPQEPDWHPEGDVFTHTCHCLDALIGEPAWQEADDSERRILTFAVLAHDFGKPATTQRVSKGGKLRWTSPGHAYAGVELTRGFLDRIGASPKLSRLIKPLVQFHLAHIDAGKNALSDGQVRRLARKIAPASMSQLLTVMRADARGRPPLSGEETLTQLQSIAAATERLAVADSTPQPLLRGRDLIARGMAPGPRFSTILAAAYEAQLEGKFYDEVTSSSWLDSYLNEASN